MTISIYRRDESGIITFEGAKTWANEFAFLSHFELLGIEPETEKLVGWPHSYVKWYVREGAPSCSAVGIGG